MLEQCTFATVTGKKLYSVFGKNVTGVLLNTDYHYPKNIVAELICQFSSIAYARIDIVLFSTYVFQKQFF